MKLGKLGTLDLNNPGYEHDGETRVGLSLYPSKRPWLELHQSTRALHNVAPFSKGRAALTSSLKPKYRCGKAYSYTTPHVMLATHTHMSSQHYTVRCATYSHLCQDARTVLAPGTLWSLNLHLNCVLTPARLPSPRKVRADDHAEAPHWAPTNLTYPAETFQCKGSHTHTHKMSLCNRRRRRAEHLAAKSSRNLLELPGEHTKDMLTQSRHSIMMNRQCTLWRRRRDSQRLLLLVALLHRSIRQVSRLSVDPACSTVGSEALALPDVFVMLRPEEPRCHTRPGHCHPIVTHNIARAGSGPRIFLPHTGRR